MKKFCEYVKSNISNFLKSIVIGFGAVSAGLSGSVLMVIFGLYQKIVDTIGNIFKGFWKNVLFLIPIVLGCAIGALAFSNIIKFFLDTFPLQTRFTFLGLIIGAVPIFYKEMIKKGFSKKYYAVTALTFALGICLLIFKDSLFPTVTEKPGILLSGIIGFAVAASSIIPGVDSAVILSAFGIYDIYLESLKFSNLSLQFLIPAGIGLGIGILLFSFIMSFLLKKCYTLTFSVIFGFFISIIPAVLNEECEIGFNIGTVLAFIFMIIGFLLSFYLSDIEKNNERLKKLFSGNKNK